MQPMFDFRDEFKHRTHIEQILFDSPPTPPPPRLLAFAFKTIKEVLREICTLTTVKEISLGTSTSMSNPSHFCLFVGV